MPGQCPDDLPAAAPVSHSYFAYINVAGVDALYEAFRSQAATVKCAGRQTMGAA